jgi:hypothetical protein
VSCYSAVTAARWLGPRAPRSRRFAAALASAAAAVAVFAAVPSLPALAIGTGGPDGFGLAPAPDGWGYTPPYFSLGLAAGRSATATAILSDTGTDAETLELGVSLGITAVNSGTAYSGFTRQCAGAACWISGLPRRVTLTAGAREPLPFTVRVPAGTPDGQYLAGLSAEVAGRPGAVRLPGSGQATVRAVVVQQVSIGVAVTVGRLPALRTRLRIHRVTSQDIGPVVRLYIQLGNAGQTFAHAAGRATCAAAGAPRSFAVSTADILPGGTASISVNAPGLPEQTPLRCTVRLRYGTRRAVTWSGLVTVPVVPPGRTGYASRRANSAAPVPRDAIGWLTPLIALSGLAVLVLAAATFVLSTRRNRAAGAPRRRR